MCDNEMLNRELSKKEIKIIKGREKSKKNYYNNRESILELAKEKNALLTAHKKQVLEKKFKEMGKEDLETILNQVIKRYAIYVYSIYLENIKQ
jgi:hypothetical protein